jgi:predicted glycoside hydrolase/deacetylase ChbG (UPF0249 family)
MGAREGRATRRRQERRVFGGQAIKVIFHGDDFGLTGAVNDGILEAYDRGLLRSTSLIVSGIAAEEAASAVRRYPGLDVGLHATLVEERPVLPPRQIPSLVRDGRFLPDFRTVGLAYAVGRWRPAEACAEIAAQWDRLAELGLSASHCDGHQHLHLLPGLLPAVVEQARARGIRFVRARPVEPVWRGEPLVRRCEFFALASISALSRWRARRRGAEVSSFVTVGFSSAGGMLTRARLLEVLDRLRAPAYPVVEVMLHPGRADADTRRRYGHWGYQWERDLALLCDPTLAEELDRRGIEVTSFRDLAASASEPAADQGRVPETA